MRLPRTICAPHVSNCLPVRFPWRRVNAVLGDARKHRKDLSIDDVAALGGPGVNLGTGISQNVDAAASFSRRAVLTEFTF